MVLQMFMGAQGKGGAGEASGWRAHWIHLAGLPRFAVHAPGPRYRGVEACDQLLSPAEWVR